MDAAGGGAISVKTLRMTPPANGTAVSLANVVVVGHVTSKKYGHIYVQDQGGGEYSGIHLFCNYGGTSPNCAMTQVQIDGLAIGAVVGVTGKFSTYAPTMPAGAPSQLEIDAPSVTASGQTMTPAALTVSAAALDMGQYTSASDPYKGAYVKIASSFAVSNTTATEFQTTCNTSTTTYGGFEAQSGSTTLAIGLNFYDTVTYCLPGCFACANQVSTQTFTSVSGVVEPDSNPNGSMFLRLSPLSDADLPQ